MLTSLLEFDYSRYIRETTFAVVVVALRLRFHSRRYCPSLSALAAFTSRSGTWADKVLVAFAAWLHPAFPKRSRGDSRRAANDSEASAASDSSPGRVRALADPSDGVGDIDADASLALAIATSEADADVACAWDDDVVAQDEVDDLAAVLRLTIEGQSPKDPSCACAAFRI